MKSFRFGSLAVLSLLPLSAPVLAAPSRKKDVKVCVRIEEKSWARDGARNGEAPLAPASPPTGASPGATPPPSNKPATPPNSVPMTDKKKSLNAPTNLANFGDIGPAVPPPAILIEPSVAPEALPPSAPPPPPGVVRASDTDAFAVDPKRYLKRLLEYGVTHEPGFESVDAGCSQTLTVELYPVHEGWTVFARYSGTEREEKVDVVHFDELDTFAERVTTALLRDRPISQTLTRTTVLSADSETEFRQIKTRPHLLFGMGGDMRLGMLPTAPSGSGPAIDKLRLENPLILTIGARNKFRGWALDATGHLDIGPAQLAPRENPGGGHVAYSVGFGFGLGFLAYADPDAVNTLYYGGGGSFQVDRYQTLGAVWSDGSFPTPGGIWGGGLNVDATLGYEFMRASALHFFVQGTVSAPAFVFQGENDQSRIKGYIPGANVEIGLLF